MEVSWCTWRSSNRRWDFCLCPLFELWDHDACRGVSEANLDLTFTAFVASIPLAFDGATIEVVLMPLYFAKRRGQCCTSGY